MITFAVFVWFCMKYIWPPLIKALEERKSASPTVWPPRSAAAKTSKKRAKVTDSSTRPSSRRRIINQAQKRANEIVEEAKDTAREEAEKIAKAAARPRSSRKSTAAREATAQRGFVELAVAGAEQILKREVDAKAHADVLDEAGRADLRSPWLRRETAARPYARAAFALAQSKTDKLDAWPDML